MGSQDEVWGHDSQGFYEGSDLLVRVVKPLGICPEADLMLDQPFLSGWGEYFPAPSLRHSSVIC